MCAWKRGTQNNLPGVIRKGHIKEFRHQTSKLDNITSCLKTTEYEKLSENMKLKFLNSSCAFICTSENGLPDCFLPYVVDNCIYIHAHEYPRCIIAAILSVDVPPNCIMLNEVHRVNSKVCTGEWQEWTVYQGERITYDCREGAIGDTVVRATTSKPPVLLKLILEIYPKQPLSDTLSTSVQNVNCKQLTALFCKSLLNCIVTLEEIYVVQLDGVSYVGRVNELYPELNDDDDSDQHDAADYVLPDFYRGMIDEFTELFVFPDQLYSNNQLYNFTNKTELPTKPKNTDIVHIRTSDDEVFPVKRKLLRPCIALTGVVQAGKGKYSCLDNSNITDTSAGLHATDEESESVNVFVDVDACTFDRVLLYLEHEARGEDFQFDPLLANELLDAAVELQVIGLQDACNKVLGSFKDRVRTTPIRLEEVIRRNLAGAVATDSIAASSNVDRKEPKKRSETLLLMSGMVFDITRWLDEHPGGSTIIPEQALNVDCTLFFEIYHASRQSFLYLKEFYIGELAVEDRELVPLPRGYSSTDSTVEGKPSDAFMEQLNRITSWRLNVTTMPKYEIFNQL